jgi:hypothetical protein
MKEELIKLLKLFIEERYEKAGEITGYSGNWSGNHQIVKETTLEDFLRFLESNQTHND